MFLLYVSCKPVVTRYEYDESHLVFYVGLFSFFHFCHQTISSCRWRGIEDKNWTLKIYKVLQYKLYINLNAGQQHVYRLCSAFTGMRIMKFNLFPVPLRLHSSYGKLIFVIISPFFFSIFKNDVISLKPGETPKNSASHQATTLINVLKYHKYDEIMTKFQFTGTGAEPHRNRTGTGK